MIFNWQEYLSLAEWLHSNAQTPGSKEASCRAAISRAYYAAFQCAMKFAVEEEDFSPDYNGGDHQRVQKHFYKKGDETRNFIYTKLGVLRDNRRQADYDEAIANTSALADSTVKLAKGVLQRLDQLKKAK